MSVTLTKGHWETVSDHAVLYSVVETDQQPNVSYPNIQPMNVFKLLWFLPYYITWTAFKQTIPFDHIFISFLYSFLVIFGE